ncbi:HAD-IA family hydrolase [Nocardiopsis sp. CA-288880]|uniref:HAD-IA family hydrolase n=1 Tax=Nocardiopsis sp. CA-288880 TaxID=3239995 RepID=UPI003D995D89
MIEASPGRTNAELVAEVAPHLDAVAEARRMVEREVEDTGGITACAGAAELVASLPRGSWAIVTSGHRPVALARLRASGLPVPEVLVTADDVRVGKPAPEGYLAAARRLGVQAYECLVIEDSAAGLLAAEAGGIRAIAVTDGKGGPHAPRDHSVSSLATLGIDVAAHGG